MGDDLRRERSERRGEPGEGTHAGGANRGAEGDQGPQPRDLQDVAADVADFVADFLEDEASGSVQPLTVYLRRFPRTEAEVAAEYLRLQGHSSPADSRATGSRDRSADSGFDDAKRVAHYRLLRLLGSGGQGEVWLAVDETLQRKVALKLLTAIFVTEERRERFRREAESIARLEHPGLAQVHDADIDGDPPYIAMRFVEGVDLGTSFAQARAHAAGQPGIAPMLPWQPRGRAELHAVLRFFERCARALHAAHAAGVLHRDVKPGNIMVTSEGGPVLLDFGLARGEEFAVESALTREGDVFGTLAYMAPEQLRGEASRVDVRSDVWSLGITLFEALVGERPFQGRGPGELAIAIDTQPVPDASANNPSISADVRVVLDTALDRAPERRYESALALAEDLRRIAEYEPIRARPAGPLLRFRRWCRREPAWAAALGVTLVALVGGLVASQVALERMRSLLDSRSAQEYVAKIPTLAENAPAGALALGLEIVALEDTWRTRSALYGPLLDSTLRAWFRLPEARVWDAVFTSGEVAIVAGVGGAIERVDIARQAVVARANLGEDVRALALDRAARRLFAGTGEGRLVSLDASTLRTLRTDALGEGPIVDIEVVGDRVVVLVAPATVVEVDRASGSEIARRDLSPGSFGSLAVAADLRLVVVSPRRFHGMRRASNSVMVLGLDGLDDQAIFDHPAPVHDVALAEGARIVATLDGEGSLRLFDLARGQPVQHPDGGDLVVPHGFGGGALAITPAADRVVVGLDVRGIDDAQGVDSLVAYRLEVVPEGGPEAGSAAGPSASRRPVRAWALGGTDRVVDLAFSPGLSRLATASWDNRVRVLDAGTGALVSDHRETNRPADLYWSPDGGVLISIGAGESVEAWRTRRSSLAFRFDGMGPTGANGPATNVGVIWGEFTADGEHVVLLDDLGRAGLFDAPRPGPDGESAPRGRSPGARLARLDPCEVAASGARAGVAAAAPRAFWVGPSGRMRCLDTANLALRADVQAGGFAAGDVVDMVVARDGSSMACVDAGGVPWVWTPGSEPRPLEPASPRTSASGTAARVRFDRAGRSVFLASLDGGLVKVRIDGASAPLVFDRPDLDQPLDPLTDLRLSPDGATIVAALARNRLVVWDATSGAVVRLPRTRLRREQVRWLDAERLMAIGTGRGAVQVLGPAGVVIPATLLDGSITGCAASSEGELAATSSVDGSVLLWNTLTGEVVARATVHGAAVRWVAIDGAGARARVLSCSDRGAAVWPVDVLDAAQRLSVRELTPGERRRLAALRLQGR